MRGTSEWEKANQRYLVAALAEVGQALDRHRGEGATLEEAKSGKGAPNLASSQLAEAAEAMAAPAALDSLCSAFRLTEFERAVLLMAAGPELDAGFAGGLTPTFGLALAALPQAHWSALSPAGALRHWRLVELDGASITTGELRVDERILHFLTGVQYLDERLAGRVRAVPLPAELLPSQAGLAERLSALWLRSASSEEGAVPVVELTGAPGVGKRAIAATLCAGLGLSLWELSAAAVPADPAELDGFLRLWRREVPLANRALLLGDDDSPSDEPAREAAVTRLIERLEAPLLVVSRSGRRTGRRPILSFAVAAPGAAERAELWRDALGEAAVSLDGQVGHIASQFQLGIGAIRAAGAEALGAVSEIEKKPGRTDENPTPATQPLARALWQACRRQARPALGSLARRIEPRANRGDLILPERQRAVLREIALHVRHRQRVYEEWGFAARSVRGQGLGALFAGASGTGKTMAAEVLAAELELDLYQIDLSSVVSKYIGETEKNLSRVFDAAEAGGAILLFDEADALFGKRSEVKDSHDRYANLEVSYLLQRMETYRGLAVLTSNRKSALDDAFLRRLRFVVEFPFPDAAAREQIWRRIYPAATPLENLDTAKLARLNVAGGNIRNIALAAAFLAAGDDRPVGMDHLLRAAQGEYAKLEKPLGAAETRGWV